MTEADELAILMLQRARKKNQEVKLNDFHEALDWAKAQWSEWNDWVSPQMIDNIAESLLVQLSKS